MKTTQTYNYNSIPINCIDLEENFRNYEVELLLPRIISLVDSRVPVNDKVVVRQSDKFLINKYRYPGFNLNKANSKDLIKHAKMLGKTYKTQSNKGSKVSKQWDTTRGVQIKKILIPTDFSETGLLALEHAVLMANLFKAQLYLMHVVETFEYVYSVYEPEVMIRDTDGIHEAAGEKIRKLAQKITLEKGIRIKTIVRSGRPASGIADVVKEHKIDLVIMGTHGASGFEEYFIGSNAHKVVNLSPCPVITIQTRAKRVGFRNIVMPIDSSLHSRQKVNYVSALAAKYGSKVHILGLLNSNEEIDAKRLNIKLDSVETVIKGIGVPYVRKLKTAKNIAQEVMEYSDKVKADLIVIMTDHESNITGMFLGGFSKQIINHSRVPVMSIKPNEHYETYQEIW